MSGGVKHMMIQAGLAEIPWEMAFAVEAAAVEAAATGAVTA